LGFASIKKVEGDSWFVNKLYVETTEQRRGMGRFLLEELIETQGIKTMRLQVNRQNYKAINFYFKMGFVIEWVADFDIGDGYFMNDFVMVWGR
jgi:ribosomal protein S18 acetylase RimI-like enzyme